MNEYIAKTFKYGDVYHPEDVNRIENQIELLTSTIKTLSSLNNIYIRYNASEPEPEDKTVLFIDLSDETENTASMIDGILNEYKKSIEVLSNEVYNLKEQVAELIASGGIIIPPDDPIEEDKNEYILTDNGLALLTSDGVPILFSRNENTSSVIDNCILTNEGRAIIVDDDKVLTFN